MKKCSYFLFFFVLICAQNLLSQNINGLKIYVSKLYTTTLYFHDVCSKYGFAEANCPYKFNSLLSDEKSIALEISTNVAEPYTLHVTEGGRRHIFVIIYKERLEDSERDIHFTDLSKLAQISKSMNSAPTSDVSKSEQPQSVPPKSEPPPAAPPKSGQPEVVEPPVVKNAANDSIESDEIKYTALVKRANDAFSSNKLDDALKYYTAALAIKPDEIYLNSQVQVIQKKIAAAKIEEDMRRKDSSFQSYISAGDKLLNDKLYSSAKIAYEEALKIKPGDYVALEKLKGVNQSIVADSIKAQQQKLEDLYMQYVNLGDTARMKKSYGPARIAYEQALQVKPNDAVAAERLRSLNQDIVNDSLDAVNQKNTALYTAFIDKANKAFDEKSFDIAKGAYDSALTVKPRDIYAGSQIKKIDSLLIEQQRQAQRESVLQQNQALQKQYSDLISKANQEFSVEMYDEALQDYAQALEINKNDQYSKNKISQIKSLLSARQLKLKQDSVNNVNYAAIIKKADDAFDTKDYKNARSFYKSSLTYKDNDEYANSRIAEIERITTEEAVRKQAEKDSLVKMSEVNKRYAKLISDAQKAFDAKDYTSARIMYSEATVLKPDEIEAKEKLSAVDSELAEIARQQAIQNKSDSLITTGEIALATQQFPLALDNFQEAMALNLPDQQYYLQRQIAYIQNQIKVLEQQRQNEERNRNFDSAMSAYNQGKDSLKILNYGAVLFYYRKFLSFVGDMDSATLEISQYNLVNISKYVRAKISDIEGYLASHPVASKDTARVISPQAYGRYALAIYYPIQKDTNLNYVIRKYPDINFYSSPPDQHFDSLLNFNVQSNLIGREIMSLKPDLDLTDSSNGVKLICQNIVFKYNYVYLKFLVQNYDSLEFLTGRMLLSYKPHDSVKLSPNYVSNYPIILGGRQKVLVYVTKPITISDQENLRFEMVDRLNKLKLAVVIPGSDYNKEQGTR